MTRRFRRGIARMIVCSLTACAMPGFTAVGQPPPPPHLVVFADGAEVPGTVTELHDRARATIAGRRLFDPAKPLRLIRLSEAAPRIPKAYVEFDNGDRLPGTVIGHRSEGFEWRELVGAAQPMNHPESLPATLQVVTMEDIVAPDRPLTRPPRDRGITICVDVRRDRVRRIVWRQDAPRKYQPKTLFLADGTASEFRSIRWSDDAVVVLQTNGTAERHPFATINELHLPPRADPWDAWFETLADDEAGVVQAVLRSGARVSFPQRQFLSAAGLNSIFVQPTWSLDPLFLPVPEIVRLLAFAPAEAPLSFLEPSRVRQASPLGTSWIWQADHNVQGGPLDLAGPPISWGCGVQARTELTWPLTTGVREFRCRVGLDRIVAGGGCVRASIHANDAAGPPLWQSEILVGSGSAADCGSLPLAGPDGGQNDLVLVADDAHRDRPPGADPFDIRDCVDWAEPLVLFDPTAVPVRTAARRAALRQPPRPALRDRRFLDRRKHAHEAARRGSGCRPRRARRGRCHFSAVRSRTLRALSRPPLPHPRHLPPTAAADHAGKSARQARTLPRLHRRFARRTAGRPQFHRIRRALYGADPRLKSPSMLQGVGTDPSALEQLHKDLGAGRNFEGMATNYRKDGTPFMMHWRVASVRSANDEVVYFIAVQRQA